jgi:hypothetical protein
MIKSNLIALLALCNCTLAQNPGLTASLDIAVLQQAKDVYFDKILDIIRHVEIPDFAFDQGYVKENTFTVTENSNNVNFTSDPANNALVFSVTDLTCLFRSADFRLKEKLVVAKGSADVFMMKNVAVTVGL